MPDEKPTIAVIDETAPELSSGIIYVVAAAVILPQPNINEALRNVVAAPNRTRPFHWRKEGPEAREKMIEVIAELGCIIHAHAVSPVGRKLQEAARSQALYEIAKAVMADGASNLLIESRMGGLDWRDGRTLSQFQAQNLQWSFQPADEPVMWIADTACGILHDYFKEEDDQHLVMLQALGVEPEITYSHLHR